MSIDPAMMARVRRDVPYEVPSLRPLPTRVRFYGEVPAWKRVAKRAIDIAFSAVALVAFGLMLPFIALAIKLDSRGPVFYSQVRVGIDRRAKDRRRDAAARGVADRRCDGQTRDRRKIVAQGYLFEIVKLRTMYTDSESDGLRWAHKGDPRITRVGKFLRVTRLDEVPQFWNVLKGEMSVVGPRPERPPFIELLSDEVPGYLDRLRFKPGITGLAQVELGYDTDVEGVQRKVEKDVDYISRFSIFRDIVILARTVTVVITGRGAN
jgi:lipopolysaccharide/colanic/teichoic acid biosynthesis glycosyltransferase